MITNWETCYERQDQVLGVGATYRMVQEGLMVEVMDKSRMNNKLLRG